MDDFKNIDLSQLNGWSCGDLGRWGNPRVLEPHLRVILFFAGHRFEGDEWNFPAVWQHVQMAMKDCRPTRWNRFWK